MRRGQLSGESERPKLLLPWIRERRHALRERQLIERMGHSSTRAALIYLHATRGRDQAIAAGMGEVFKDATERASVPADRARNGYAAGNASRCQRDQTSEEEV